MTAAVIVLCLGLAFGVATFELNRRRLKLTAEIKVMEEMRDAMTDVGRPLAGLADELDEMKRKQFHLPPTSSLSSSSWRRPTVHGMLALALSSTACGPNIYIYEPNDDATDVETTELETETDAPPDVPEDLPGCPLGTLYCPCDDGECEAGLECDPVAGACFEAGCTPDATTTAECGTDGMCWTWATNWSSWAHWAEPTDLADAINSGALTPTNDELGLDAVCFDLLGANHHVCVVEVDCIELYGRPANEVAMVESACAENGPWSFVGETPDPFGECWGVVNGVAVILDPEH